MNVTARIRVTALAFLIFAFVAPARAWFQEPSITDYAPPGTTDWTAAINLALSSNPGVKVRVPPGYYAAHAFTIPPVSGSGLKGAGPGATFLVSIDLTGDFITAGGGGLTENNSLTDMTLTSGYPRTSGATIVFDRVTRFDLSNVEIASAYRGIQYGTPANPEGNVIIKHRNLRVTAYEDALYAYGGSAYFFDGMTHLNGVDNPNSAGYRCVGPVDGVDMEGAMTIENFGVSIAIMPQWGSAANHRFRNISMVYPHVAALRLEPSGSGAINGVSMTTSNIFGNPARTAAVGILIDRTHTTGAIQHLQVFGNTTQDMVREFLNSYGAPDDAWFTGNLLMGSTANNGAHPAFNWNGGAATQITQNANTFANPTLWNYGGTNFTSNYSAVTWGTLR